MVRTALYPGSFDPITNGHIDIIGRAARLVDRLVIAVGIHHGKAPLFTGDERVDLIEEITQGMLDGSGVEIKVITFDGLVVDAMKDHGADILVRGLRDTTDYNYEMQMAGMNTELAPSINVVFLPSSPPVRHIAASLVRQIASMGGDVAPFVPAAVHQKLVQRFKGQN